MKKNSSEEELGNSRESWCTLERDISESWLRKQRRHYKNAMNSVVFMVRHVGYSAEGA